MLKRMISILLTVLMCMSMVTFTAMADGVVTVTYLNADSTKIMVDLSAEVAVADLKAAITLTKDGAAVTNFDVVKKPATPTATGGMTASDDYSYVIVPTGGITFDAVYNLKINSSLLGAECNKYFSVEKLWKEDFQSASYTTSFPWKDANGTGTLTLETENTNKVLKVVTGSKYASVIPDKSSTTVFGDTGVAAKTYWADDSEARLQENYNVELKVKFDTLESGDINRSLRLFMQKSGSYWADYSLTRGVAGGARYYLKADGTSTAKKMYAQTGTSRTNLQGAGNTSNLVNALGSVDVSDEPFGEGYSTFSMSVKDLSVKVFAGDNAFVNYSYDTAYEATDCGMVNLVSYSTTIFYVDDIIATKMSELTFGELEIPYWNADSSKIMLDLSAEVDADALKNAITLTKDDEPVENFTVVAKPASPTSQGTMTANANYSYVIEPQDGIALSTPSNEHKYSLTVAQGLISKDQTKRLSETYSVNFAVDKLWIEDFENESYNTSAVGTFPWKDHGGTANLSLVTEGDNTVLEVSNAKSGTTIRPNSDSGSVFADTGLTAAQCWNSAAVSYVGGFLDKEDYSVEATVRALETTATSQNQSRSIRIFMQSTPTTSSFGYASGVAGGGYYAKNASTGAITKQMYAQVGLTKGGNVAGDMQGITTAVPQVNALNPINVSHEPFASTYSTLSMSVKDKNVKVFAGDNAFISYNYTLDVSDYGCVAFTTHSSRTFYLDDIVVTKAREVVVGPKFGTSLNVVNAEEGKVNVSWEYDGKGNNLPCKVILACYGENNSLKNVIPWDGTNLSGNGTITFENFELKGGTELKLFVWKDFTTLYPYCATVQWPQAN